jgi:hypothetical protein
MLAVAMTLLATIVLGVVVAGMGFENFALWKLSVFGLPFLGFSLAFVYAKDRLRFLLLSTVLALPFLGLNVPPGRLGLTVFDVLSIPTAVVLLMSKISKCRDISLFPSDSAALALFLLVPSLVTSISFFNSVASLIVVGEMYLFFVILTHYMRSALSAHSVASCLSGICWHECSLTSLSVEMRDRHPLVWLPASDWLSFFLRF